KTPGFSGRLTASLRRSELRAPALTERFESQSGMTSLRYSNREEGSDMKSGMVRVWLMPFAVLIMLLGRADPTAADGIRAAAAVKGEVFGNVGAANVIGDGNSGLSIAAAKVFNPVKDPKAISKTVGNMKVAGDQRVPTAGGTEDKRLNDALEALAGLPA